MVCTRDFKVEISKEPNHFNNRTMLSSLQLEYEYTEILSAKYSRGDSAFSLREMSQSNGC